MVHVDEVHHMRNLRSVWRIQSRGSQHLDICNTCVVVSEAEKILDI
jgi:hypothetical protein